MAEKKIMVVDDEVSIRKMYVKGLSRAGYSVHAAENADQAIAMLPNTACMVFFLDLNLPNMNGIELCKHIRRWWPLTIRYAVTGYASQYELNDCREAGFEDYFLKPLSLTELSAIAGQAFAKIERWKSTGLSV